MRGNAGRGGMTHDTRRKTVAGCKGDKDGRDMGRERKPGGPGQVSTFLDSNELSCPVSRHTAAACGLCGGRRAFRLRGYRLEMMSPRCALTRSLSLSRSLALALALSCYLSVNLSVSSSFLSRCLSQAPPSSLQNLPFFRPITHASSLVFRPLASFLSLSSPSSSCGTSTRCCPCGPDSLFLSVCTRSTRARARSRTRTHSYREQRYLPSYPFASAAQQRAVRRLLKALRLRPTP
jgi:hypothetical protein